MPDIATELYITDLETTLENLLEVLKDLPAGYLPEELLVSIEDAEKLLTKAGEGYEVDEV